MKITILFLRRNKYSIVNVYYIIAIIHFVVNGTFKNKREDEPNINTGSKVYIIYIFTNNANNEMKSYIEFSMQ